jgi:hypothetical protein
MRRSHSEPELQPVRSGRIGRVETFGPAGLYRFLPVYKDLFVEKYIRGSPQASM